MHPPFDRRLEGGQSVVESLPAESNSWLQRMGAEAPSTP